ncbi:hypothetical protein M3I54_24785 [Paraburkholderia sp. CNPSo 3274]|nr:hypothetical protein [Paraburkholderia sp. CNPSo 3274]MCP3710143.1 hypothetical protein [Paraburkholderia sp. CNPSo 3274]
MTLPFFTIGHSDRTLDDFIGLLRGADIGMLADVIARGETVLHIMSAQRHEHARLTAGAVVRPDGSIVYPASHRRAITDTLWEDSMPLYIPRQ